MPYSRILRLQHRPRFTKRQEKSHPQPPTWPRAMASLPAASGIYKEREKERRNAGPHTWAFREESSILFRKHIPAGRQTGTQPGDGKRLRSRRLLFRPNIWEITFRRFSPPCCKNQNPPSLGSYCIYKKDEVGERCQRAGRLSSSCFGARLNMYIYETRRGTLPRHASCDAFLLLL